MHKFLRIVGVNLGQEARFDMKTTPPTSSKDEFPEDLIRRCAYELWEQRGREDGHELEDWLQAESEVLEAQTRKAA